MSIVEVVSPPSLSNINSAEVGSGWVILRWAAPLRVEGEAAVSYYTIQAQLNGGRYVTVADNIPADATSYNVTM